MSAPKNSEDAPTIGKSDVGKGAGMAAMARLGALVELAAQPAYIWMFGLATYGLYAAFWSAISLLGFSLNLGLHQALQRLVPGADNDEQAHAIVRFTLLAAMVPVILAVIVIGIAAPHIAPYFSGTALSQSDLIWLIRIFSISLPLLILLEIATAAVRAQRAFGPEIRLRIFWEQVSRLVIAGIFFALGYTLFGLFAAHIASLAITGVFALRLLARYYDAKLILTAKAPTGMRRNILATGLAMMPPIITRRAFNDLPPVLLTLTISGTVGLQASALYVIARKVASVPLIVRQAFLYVLAPLSSAQAKTDRKAIAPLYGFANRLAAIIMLPLAMAMALIGDVILMLFPREASVALPILIVLLAGRAGETLLGAATPIVEMTGHRALPLINSLLGLVAAAICYYFLPPEAGAVGMALAVAIGVSVASWVAVLELKYFDKIPAWDRHFLWAVLQQSAGSILLIIISKGIAQQPDLARLGIMLTAMLMVIWLGLKFALDADDKQALGKTARILRL
ncbi:lipopolysaccharide biosynthesis protein [Parasphingorhabdus sp. DH2-15]|uniref:lipopolysaccharide biosynthesis protein n=1 Tax=Parasphingorhabdus sp. DH2-15 TaxID=3444112 RepID=UPI003F687711